MSKKAIPILYSLHSGSPLEVETFLPFHMQVMAKEAKKSTRGGVKVPAVCEFPSEGMKENSQSHLPLWTSFEISSFNAIISRDGPPFAACADGAA